MRSFLFFHNYSFYKVVLQRFMVLTTNELKFPKHMELRFYIVDSLGNEQRSFLNMLKILEVLSGRKAVVTNKELKYVGTSKRFFFGSKVTLRKKAVVNLVDYLYFVLSPVYVKRHGFFKQTIIGNRFSYFFDDYTVFFNLTLPIVSSVLNCEFFFNSYDRISFFNFVCLRIGSI